MTFSKTDLESIKAKLSLRSEFEKKTKIVQKGKDYWCCCPFHEEKTPSCKINDDYGSFYCFGCGAKGDIFTFYTDLYNYNFIDAVKELSLKAGVNINFDINKKIDLNKNTHEILEIASKWFQENLQNASSAKCNDYLKKRKLTKETIENFQLGYSNNNKLNLYEFLKSKSFSDKDILDSNLVKLDQKKNFKDYFYKRLMFPIKNVQGRVVGFGGRSLDGSNPKYINSPESNIFQKRFLLYNLNFAKNFARKKNNLLICEGYMDVISLNQNGVFSVVAPLGTALTENQIELAWKYSTKPTIMFDGDNAGLRASYKTAIMALPFLSAKKFLQFITLPNNSDPDNYINEISIKEFTEILKKPESLSNYIFNQSIKSVELNKVDEKILFDKYLDNLIESIKDQKIKYFYKNEFKSLFFSNIRKINNKNQKNSLPKRKNVNLTEKQHLSFFASAINHLTIRKKILDELLKTQLFNENEISFINKLKEQSMINMEIDEIIQSLQETTYSKILKECLSLNIYQLFPYSSPKFDPQETLNEVVNSLNNLNTRLLNLKKINKSLDTFLNNSNQLNWNDLQNINMEILNKD